MTAVQRVQIPITFQYNNSGNLAPAPSGLAVTIFNQATSSPATVYANDAPDNTTIPSPVTDTNGAVAGWLVEGTYQFTVPASGGFSGATIVWNAVRGDGVENIFAGAVNTTAIASGAVTAAKVASGTLTTSQISGSANITGNQLANNTVSSTQATKNLKRLNTTVPPGNYTAVAGDWVIASPNAVITYPSAASNTDAQIGVEVLSGVTNTNLVALASSDGFRGIGMTGSTFLVPLGNPFAFIIFQSDGAVWRQIGGMQDSGWANIGGFTSGVSSPPVAGFQIAQVRLVGDQTRLRGGLLYSGGGLGPNTAWATLSSTYAPPTKLSFPGYVGTSGTANFYIDSSGNFKTLGFSSSGDTMTLGGVTFTID